MDRELKLLLIELSFPAAMIAGALMGFLCAN